MQPQKVNDMTNKKSVKDILIIFYVAATVLIFALVLIIPASREVFGKLSSEHPYIMGFIKFSLLATSGELVAAYIKNAKPTLPAKIICRFLIWGVIGIWITFMMKIYSSAVASMTANGMLIGGDNVFLRALYTSVVMNSTFAPTFMALHKCSDTFLELKAAGKSTKLDSVIKEIDWSRFCSFTILKTVPLFWIPAHTITFLLPSQYQVMMAAALSVALGIMLSISSRKAKQ